MCNEANKGTSDFIEKVKNQTLFQYHILKLFLLLSIIILYYSYDLERRKYMFL